jgi:hypothetical protein
VIHNIDKSSESRKDRYEERCHYTADIDILTRAHISDPDVVEVAIAANKE